MDNWRNGADDYDKGDLKGELKNSGFSSCVADDIADRVNDRKGDKWTQMQAREAAMREIDTFLSECQRAYDNFRTSIGIARPIATAPL